jgi:hypothetical protein
LKRLLSHSVEIEFIDCAACAMTFGLTADFIQRRRNDGANFYCPNGHTNHYRENEQDRIRQERDRLKQQTAQYEDWLKEERERRETAERSASARKGQITRMKNRAAAGVCPCCSRSFENHRRHMSTKHPSYKAEEVA